LGLLYSEVPAAASGAFTTNRFQASPIKISKAHLKNRLHQAIVVNSGNANCANGKIGDRDALLVAEFIAKNLEIHKGNVLVASTGIIGKYLDTEKIRKNIPKLVKGLSKRGGVLFSDAILTTDTKRKEFAVKVKLRSHSAAIGGACKGVGMIYPNIKTERHATMLCFITTDAAISKRMLEEAIFEAAQGSFNMISVDGDMSTNDAFFILANGLAGNKTIFSKNGDYHKFLEALKFTAKELAKMMVKDGEGATKFVEIKVAGAESDDDAKAIARMISRSTLLKCAIFGSDPNWGRIAAACGASGVGFDSSKIDIYLGDVKVMSGGMSVKGYDEGRVKSVFKKDNIHIKVDLKSGSHSATAWTCDLSKKYVDINAEYPT